MPAPETRGWTTVRDVTLDTIAALDQYAGLMGSETETIQSVGPTLDDDRLVLVLSNGDEYQLVVSLIREGRRSE